MCLVCIVQKNYQYNQNAHDPANTNSGECVYTSRWLSLLLSRSL